MGLPSGTSYFVPIVVNREKVGEAATSLLYQINFSSKLVTDSVFKGYITTAANIAVYDADLNSTRPRRVVLDLTNNKLLIYWDGVASTAINKKFYVCVGAEISQTDSVSAFTNSGITKYLGFDDDINSSVAIDYVGNNSGTIISPAAISSNGKFGNALQFVQDNSSLVNLTPFAFGLTAQTISFVIKRGATTGTYQYLFVDGKVEITLNNTSNATITYTNLGASGYATFTNALPNIGEFYHVTFLRKLNGNVALFINGTQLGIEQAAGALQNGIGLKIGSWANTLPTNAMIDSFCVINSIVSTNCITTNYNMVFGATFFSVDIGVIIKKSAKRHSIHTGVSVSI
jgi:hypothetical protein